MLRQDDANQIIGSTKLQRRESILAKLDEAESIDKLGQSDRKSEKVKDVSSLESGEYLLVKGKGIRSSHDEKFLRSR